MVAVVSGNGLGLFNTSFTQLGTSLWGQAGMGQSRESQYVNIATGNLVLQDWDERITVRGFDATLLRTYNSLGTVGGAGQDGFITGYERSLILSGTLNNAASTVVLQTGDGQSITFKYSGTSNKYTTTDGDGANDTLTWSSTTGTWIYVEGSSQREELYGAKTGASDTPTSQAATVTASAPAVTKAAQRRMRTGLEVLLMSISPCSALRMAEPPSDGVYEAAPIQSRLLRP